MRTTAGGRVGRFSGLLVATLLLGAGCQAPDDGGRAGSEYRPPELRTKSFAVRTQCGPATTTLGMDVSVWQGTIDWDDVAATNVRFAWIRIGDGLGGDSQFARNWTESRRVGVRRGAYHYFRPNLDGAAQAAHFLEVVDAAGGYRPDDLPPMLDLETTGSQSAATIRTRISAWLDAVEDATGKRPILYTGPYFWDDNGLGSGFAGWPLWTAHWTTGSCPLVPNAWSAWTVWQYTSSGSVSGISGNVDLDRFAGDLAALDAWAGANTDPGDDDHGDTRGTATALATDVTTPGVIELAGDVDVFRVSLPTASSIGAYTRGPTDTECALVDSAGTELARNDDSHGSLNCLLKRRPLAAGTYYFVVSHHFATGTGSYSVRVNRPVD